MPFTFSHPALILPLRSKHNKWKRFFSTTGLITGSVAPDFESFIRLTSKKIYSHTWGSMFWFDLPLAFIICMLFQLVVRDPLIDNLPPPLEERFTSYRGFKWLEYLKKNFLIVIISLLIGIASHLLWDAFTHLNLYDPDSTQSKIKFRHIRVYIILQYGCSAIGILFIGWVIHKMPRTKIRKVHAEKFKYWLYVSLSTILIGAYLLTTVDMEVDQNGYMTGYAVFFINLGIASFLSALVVVSIIYRWLFKKNYNYYKID